MIENRFSKRIALSYLSSLLLSPSLAAGSPAWAQQAEFDNDANDISVMAVTAPVAVAPAGFPPFPDLVDLPVTLEPDRPTRLANWQSLPNHSQAEAVIGEQYLRQRKVVDGFAALKYAVEINKWRSTDVPSAAQCHSLMAEILSEYAFKAKQNGEGSKGMKRLMNSWLEYRQALFTGPSNDATRAGMLKVSQAIVGINPSFNNILALGSALVLTGDSAGALNCYRQCADMIQKGTSNASPELAAALSAQMQKMGGPQAFPSSGAQGPYTQPAGSFAQAQGANSQPEGANSQPQGAYPQAQGSGQTESPPALQAKEDAPLQFQQRASSKDRSFYVDDYAENAQRSLAREWRLSHVQTTLFPTVAFTVDKHGNIGELRVAKSSGDSGIDEIGLNVVRRVAPFPDSPEGIGEISFTFDSKKDPVDLADYMRQLRRKIRHNWHPPHDLQEDHVMVSFKLNRDGSVANLQLIRPSASEARNKSSLDAIAAAAPFQHLPDAAPDSVDIQFHFDHDVEAAGN